MPPITQTQGNVPVLLLLVGHEGHATALQGALEDFGLDWQVARAGQGASAMALPEDLVPDVVLCEAEVGPHYGPALLAQLRSRYPDAIRVLALEDGQDGDVLQALDFAHRVLRMPLDPMELMESVEGAMELRALLDDPGLKQAIDRVGALPPAPRMYFQLTRLLADANATSAQIAAVLEQDPAIVASVLRLCNSAYFSAGREIADLRTAVTRLGIQNLRQLVLASEALAHGVLPPAERDAMQERALRTSKLAAQILPGASADLAATAGLLSEVGRLLPTVDVPAANGQPRHHTQAGAYLLGLWGLPTPIVEAVAHHPTPAQLRGSGFWIAGAVHVASSLVQGTPLDEAYLQRVGQIDRLPKWRALAEAA